jgi:4-amino-4-deoxy-L-arabinose transferase-like glycosyltransferase
MANDPAATRWWQQPGMPPRVIGALSLAIHLAMNGRYGFHTDELYYIECGLHPALGYVDFPALTPLLARLDTSLFGIHPWTLRLFPAVAVALVVYLTGLCAREMGGGYRATGLASALALLSPLLLGTWLFQTVAFDQLTWTIAIFLFLLIVRTGEPRLFILLGLDLGVGIETKFTILGLCAGIAFAILLSPQLRPLLRTPYPWLGMAIALAAAAPNAAWQFANGFPTLTYIHNHGTDIASGGGIGSYAALFLLTMGPLFLPLWIAGLVVLWRDRRLRPIAVMSVGVVVLLAEGKGYYPAPAVPPVLAAACVGIEGLRNRTRARWTRTAILAGGLVEALLLSAILLPVVPPSSLHSSGVDSINADFANTVGWQNLTSQVGAVYNGLPAAQRVHAAILTDVDGAAGAIDIYGGPQHLPQALSPHLNFWYWKPSNLDATTLVTLGYGPRQMGFLCGSVTHARKVRLPYKIVNLEQGAPILICTHLHETINAAWPRLKDFS